MLVVTTSDEVVGYGEACPVPAFTAETQESIVALVEQRVKPLLVGEDPLRHRLLLRRLERVLFGCPFTLAAVDIALGDVAGKLLGLPISALLGGRFRERIEMHGSVGWDDPGRWSRRRSPSASMATGRSSCTPRGHVAADLGRIDAVRTAVGSSVDIRLLLDVNGMWSVSQCLEALPRLSELVILLLEQPLAASDEVGQAEAVRASRWNIRADESIYSAADVARIGRQRTARVINLGLSKLGGLLRAGECETVARALGLGITGLERPSRIASTACRLAPRQRVQREACTASRRERHRSANERNEEVYT